MLKSLKSLPRTVWLLGVISLVNDAASDMIYPLVPLYLTSVLMAGPKALGLIEGIAEAVSSLLKLVAGVLADRSRKVKYWVVAGYGIAGVARPLLAFATSWLGVLACRVADRVGKGLRTAPRDALLTLSVNHDQRGLAFGFHRAMDNFGAVVGPLLAAGLLALGMPLKQVLLCAFVPAAIVLWLALAVPEPQHAAESKPIPFSWNLREFPPAFKRYLVVIGLVHSPIVAEPVVRPVAILACVTVVLLLPLAAPRFGVAVVVTGIAVGCALLTAFAVTSKPKRARNAPSGR